MATDNLKKKKLSWTGNMVNESARGQNKTQWKLHFSATRKFSASIKFTRRNTHIVHVIYKAQ